MTIEAEIRTDLITITPSTTELESPEIILSTKISTVVAGYMTLSVTDEPTSITASDALTRVRTFAKGIEEQRKIHLQPLNDYVKTINSRFATLKQPIEKAETHLLQQIQAYRNALNVAAKREQQRQNRLAEKRADRAEAKGIESPIPEIIAPLVMGAPKSMETDAGKISYRVDWKAEIVDASKLPREYLIPDEPKINAVVRASRGTIKIPGVRIYSVEVPIVRMK